MKRIFSSSRYANVTATLALVIALGGTSYAAVILPANSVGNRQLRSSAVTTAKVKNGSLLKTDFRTGQLPRGAAGAVGPAGPRGFPGLPGAPGVRGSAGPASLAALDYKFSNLFENLDGEQTVGAVSCDDGMHAVGGGVVGESEALGQNINGTGPSGDGRGWVGFVDNASGADSAFTVYAVCTTASTVSFPVEAIPRHKK